MTDIFLSTFPHTALALFCCEASFSFCIFYFGSVHFVCAVPCARMCVFVRNSMHYLHRICEPEIKPCFSVWETGVFGGGGVFFVIHFVNGCGIQPVSVSAKHNQHRGGFSNPCLLSTLQNESTSHLLSLQNDRAQGNPCSRMPSPCVNCIKMISTFIPLLFSSDELYGCRLLYPPLVMLQ